MSQTHNPSGSHKNKWDNILADFTELHQPHPTHFTSSSSLLKRIDHGYTSTPPSLLIKIGITASVVKNPDTYWLAGLSDHSPLGFSFHPKFLQNNVTSSFPKVWFETKAYVTCLEVLIGSFNWDNFGPLEKLRTLKLCIKSAAFYSRDVLFFSDSNGSVCKRQVLESISRAVWRNDRKLAQKLLDVSSLAGYFIEIKEGKVVPLDPLAFEQVHAVENSII